MALLDRLLPPWRQSDPEVRAAAVRQLAADAQDILETVARKDDDPRVRRIAVKKLDDPNLLMEIANSDGDEEIRTLASARAEEQWTERALSDANGDENLVALAHLTRTPARVTVATRARDPRVRQAALDAVHEDRALSDISRRSQDAKIGLQALARISDAALLPRIATSNVSSEVALAAVERIREAETLTAIIEDAQVDKSVRKRARAMLSNVLHEEHPLTVADRRERQLRLCTMVERLNPEADPAAAIETVHDAEEQWRELSARDTDDGDLAQRFRRACAEARDAATKVEQRRDIARRRDAAGQHVVTSRRELCDTVEKLEGPEIPAALERVQASWRQLGPIEDPHSRELAARFAAAVERCQRRHERWQARESFRSQLESLVEAAEQLFPADNAAKAASRRAELERRWAGLESTPEAKKWMAEERMLVNRFVEAGYALRDQQRKVKVEREQQERDTRQQLTALCDRLEALAQAEDVARGAAESAVAASKEFLHRSGIVSAALRPLRQRLAIAQQALERRIELYENQEEWKRWANADVQQQLIARAEALIAEGDPKKMLGEVAQLDQEWKRAAVAPRPQSQALWQRFRTARNQLRQAVDGYLAENLAKKEALCVAVEQLADSTEWNATADAIIRMQAEWKQIGPVRQKLSAALFERFRAPANRFFERRKADLAVRKQRRQEMFGQMQELCEKAESLSASSDWESTAREMKKLQAEAQRIFRPRRPPRPAPAAVEGAEAAAPLKPPKLDAAELLQQRFRTAVDSFFDRYRRRDQIALEGRVSQAEAILAELATLADRSAAPEETGGNAITEKLAESMAAWRGVGALPSDKAKELNERFDVACAAVEQAWPESFADEDIGNLKQREKLCTRIERLVTQLEESRKVPAPANDLGEKLRLAMAANTIGGRKTTDSEQERIAAREEIQRVKAKWQRLGPVIGGRARELARRFEQAATKARLL